MGHGGGQPHRMSTHSAGFWSYDKRWAQGEAADCGDDPGLATDDETYGDGLDPAVLSDHDGDDDLPSGVAGA